jgi:O-antigen/teichoic acid export membrane protein
VCLLVTAIVLGVPLRRLLPPGAPEAAPGHKLRQLVARAWAPVMALALIAWLQDGHVIIVKHVATDDDAGAWAAAAVAGKAIIWVAIGVGLYLVPEAAHRARGDGDGDARGVLIRTLGLIGALGSAMVLVYAVAAEPLLRIVFDLTGAAGALPWLGLAMVLLALSYLAVQYLLALHHAAFIWLLAVAAVVQPAIILGIGDDLTGIAIAIFAVQATLSAALLTWALRTVSIKGGSEWAAIEVDEPEPAAPVTTGA